MPEPLRLAPSRRPFVQVVLLTAVGPVLGVAAEVLRVQTAGRNADAHAIGTILVFVGAVVTLVCVRSLAITVRGFTEVWPDGLYNRLVGRVARVTWEQAERFEVVPTPFGRFVQVVIDDGARISLAAPRAGLLIRSDEFDRRLSDLCSRPGGGRAPVAVRHRSRYLLIAQVFLLAIFAAALVSLALR
ncbi:hypothetical protein [Actinomadura fibrosa]|uniref:PH domain-containing protein n=1 Tax=Actinomadura fibrosa TaxID=111802 RepID=A0ABW2Y2R1_9ACTN|nr:hypothetical protein [Actinomadura fibrosa]